MISIHALREEGDLARCNLFLTLIISIHALREEGDLDNLLRLSLAAKFLSTPSARRATAKAQGLSRRIRISIHALREEGDTLCF